MLRCRSPLAAPASPSALRIRRIAREGPRPSALRQLRPRAQIRLARSGAASHGPRGKADRHRQRRRPHRSGDPYPEERARWHRRNESAHRPLDRAHAEHACTVWSVAYRRAFFARACPGRSRRRRHTVQTRYDHLQEQRRARRQLQPPAPEPSASPLSDPLMSKRVPATPGTGPSPFAYSGSKQKLFVAAIGLPVNSRCSRRSSPSATQPASGPLLRMSSLHQGRATLANASCACRDRILGSKQDNLAPCHRRR